MARDVIDAAVADFGRWVPASVTDQLPLLGADGLAAAAAEAERLAEDYGLPRRRSSTSWTGTGRSPRRSSS